MYQNCCKKCGSTSLHTETKKNNTGLYCNDCGAWVKWLGKDELRAFEYSIKNDKNDEFINNCVKTVDKSSTEEMLNDKTIVKNLQSFIEFLEKQIDERRNKGSVIEESFASRSTYISTYETTTYENIKRCLENIIVGKDWRDDFWYLLI